MCTAEPTPASARGIDGTPDPRAPSCPAGVDTDGDGDAHVDLSHVAIFSQNLTGSH
jgi:hypothetical protein